MGRLFPHGIVHVIRATLSINWKNSGVNLNIQSSGLFNQNSGAADIVYIFLFPHGIVHVIRATLSINWKNSGVNLNIQSSGLFNQNSGAANIVYICLKQISD